MNRQIQEKGKTEFKKMAHRLHKHKKKKSDIFIFTIPRSGSTLLTDIMNSDPKSKVAGEPFALRTQSVEVLKKYVTKNNLSERYTDISLETWNEILRYLSDLSRGKTWNAYYWSDFFTTDHSFFTSRTIYKIQKLTYHYKRVLDHFSTDYGLYLLRHPASNSLSRIRNGWDHYIEQYLSAKHIKERITTDQRKLALSVLSGNDRLLQFVVSWCLENYVFISDYNVSKLPRLVTPILYEDLVIKPIEEITRICNHVDVVPNPKMFEKLTRTSKSLIHSERKTITEIKDKNKDYLVNRWKENVSEIQYQRISNILHVFNVSFY